MPFTPFHFGPGAAFKAAIPRYFSFTVFCFAQVVTDCETAYYMFRGEYPLHRWLHTYVGATAVAVFCILAGRPICQFFLQLWKSHSVQSTSTKPRISFAATSIAAFVGTYTHVLLDNIMHSDVKPLRPFSEANALYGTIAWIPLHLLCIGLGVVGFAWMVARADK